MVKELWTANEIKHMSLKDKRRNERAKMMLEAMTDNPASSISQACNGLQKELIVYTKSL